MTSFSSYRAKMCCFLMKKKNAILRHFWNYMHDNTNNKALFCMKFIIKDMYKSFLIPTLPKIYIFDVLFMKYRHICYPTPYKRRYTDRAFSTLNSLFYQKL